MRFNTALLTLSLLVIGVIVPAFAQRTADESRRRVDSMARVDGLMRLDTHRLDLRVDGRDRAVKVVAYMAGGQIFIKGLWLNDAVSKLGPEAVISSCVMRFPAVVGEHRIIVDTMNRAAAGTFSLYDRQFDTTTAAFFTAMYSGAMKDGRAFAIYRSDWNGGQGSVTISSIAPDGIQGRFTLTSYNENNPRETKEVSGQFMLPLQRWADDYYTAR